VLRRDLVNYGWKPKRDPQYARNLALLVRWTVDVSIELSSIADRYEDVVVADYIALQRLARLVVPSLIDMAFLEDFLLSRLEPYVAIVPDSRLVDALPRDLDGGRCLDHF
jgi:hypothetical protein